MEMYIPEPLKIEHNELHTELAKATKASGKIGKAAKVVAELLHPHFVKEEEYALPQLGLLSSIAQEKITPDMKEVLPMIDKLKGELNQMLQEHQAIISALDKLADAAKLENKTEYVHFAEKLKLHARTEEEILYPASILIGEYLKLKL